MEKKHSSENSVEGTTIVNKRTHKLRRKAYTLLALLKNGDWQGIAERLTRYATRLGLGKRARRQRQIDACEPGIDIICTPHTRFVALRMRLSLEMLGIGPVRIFDAQPARYAPKLHIVICPQMVAQLPANYIAMQMEQSVSSRWFDQAYIDRLENSVAIMDYSLHNIAYLQDSAGLSHRQIFYTPVSNLPRDYLYPVGQAKQDDDPTSTGTEPTYDIAFYGDANTPRRQAFLSALEQHYSVLRISEVFGEALYAQLARARVIVNIHYYEGALLETTRLYECLSLGHSIVSESSVDIHEHALLKPYITFTPIGDIDAMVAAVGERLNQTHTPPELPDDIAHFHFYFARLLVANNLLDAQALDAIPSPLRASQLAEGVGLSLPETHQRRLAFQASYPGYPVFPGLRHHQGWRGCALSYRYLARQASACGVKSMEIREDDAGLEGDASERWQKATQLSDARPDLDVLCGLVADVAEDVNVLETLEHDGERYIVVNRMTSMVCNRYGTRAIQALAEWPFDDTNVERNTIDRYLEGLSLNVLVPLPFIAQHRAESRSTLWQFQNTTYDPMIEASEQRLIALSRQALESREGQ